MHRFVARHAQKITGVLRGFDRVVFRGHLLPLCHEAGVRSFLSSQGALLKHFGRFVESVTGMIRDGAAAVTDRLQIPVQYLESSRIQVTSQPRDGNALFSVTCEDAPPLAVGFLVLGMPLPLGYPVPPVTLHVWPVVLALTGANAHGHAEVALPVPNGTGQPTIGFQFVWFKTPNCNLVGLSASNALRWN